MAGFSLRQFVISLIGALLLAALLSSQAGASSSSGSSSECVVLLHGLARTSRSMHKIERALEKKYQVVSSSYPSRHHPIKELASLAIKPSLEQCNQAGKIHFVTHSLGGILIRQYLHDHPLDSLGRVVMLGPPNQGSELVDYFDDYVFYKHVNGPAGSQLGTGPDSVPINLGPVNFDLGIIAGNQSFNPFYSNIITQENDGKVSVERSKVQGMKDHLVLPVSHTFMMRDQSVIDQVEHFLSVGAFKRQTETTE